MRAYRRLFEDRIDVRPLAVCRVFIGVAAFMRGLRTCREIDRVLRPDVIPAPTLDWLSGLWPPAAGPWVPAYIATWLVCATCFTVGLRTRWSGGILASLIAFQLSVDRNLWSHSIYLLSLLVLLLVIGNSGRDLSIDWIRRGRPHAPRVPRWPILLFKLQVAFVYFFTASAKVNPTFLSGRFFAGRLATIPGLPGFVYEPWGAEALAYATVGIEYFLAFGLWFRRTRWWAIASGLLLHVVVPVLEPGVGIFSLIIIGTYACFCDADEIRSLVRSMTRRSGRFALQALLLLVLLGAAGIALPYPVLSPNPFPYGEGDLLAAFFGSHRVLFVAIAVAFCPLGMVLAGFIVGALSGEDPIELRRSDPASVAA